MKLILTTRMGFEPTGAEHIGLAVQRLSHSATLSDVPFKHKHLSSKSWFCTRTRKWPVTSSSDWFFVVSVSFVIN